MTHDTDAPLQRKVIDFLFGLLVTFPVLTILRGYVISKLWLWHITTVIHVRSISVSESVSVALFVTVIRFAVFDYRTTDKDPYTHLGEGLGGFLFLLGLGWLVHVAQVWIA